jgi:surfeit locus 1 family protein
VRPGGALPVLLSALAGALVCARLGFWQLERAAGKRAAHAAVEARLAEPPLELGESLPAAAPGPGRRVRVRGRWDRERHVLLSGRGHLATPGVSVVTPLVLGSGVRVLVERGWLEAADSRTAHPELIGDSIADVEGVPAPLAARSGASPWAALAAARPGVELWSARTLDSAQVLSRIPAPVALWVVRALPAAGGVESRGVPLALPLREGASGEQAHLGYAIQWFAIAVLLAAGGIALVLRRRGASPARG